MDRTEFLNKLFTFFKTDNRELLTAYDIALSVKYLVDWNKLYHNIIKTTEKRMLPMPKALLDMLPSFRIYETKTSKEDGQIVYLELNNGYKYTFTVSAEAKTSIDDIRKRTDIKKLKKFPIGTVIMGNKVAIDKGEEVELKEI